MKIEIGEYAIKSWLIHIKKCQLVQINWKKSPKWNGNIEMVDEIIKCFENKYRKENINLFKKYNKPNNVLSQHECDAVGVKINENSIEYFAVEVAYHINGLNYGKNDDKRNVVAKCIKNAIALYEYFNAKTANILFISPKISNNKYEVLLKEFKQLEECFNKNFNLNYKFTLIANKVFSEEIIDKLLNITNEINDDNDLFMRSCQLVNINSN